MLLRGVAANAKIISWCDGKPVAVILIDEAAAHWLAGLIPGDDHASRDIFAVLDETEG